MPRWLYRDRSTHAISHALARRLRTDRPAVLLTTKDAGHSPPTVHAQTRVADVRVPAAWLPSADIEITGTLPEAAGSYATERRVAERSC